MIIGTFNGWNVLAVPSTPSFAQAEFFMNDKVDATPNPFNQKAQVLDWQADWWSVTASLPPMPRSIAAQWIALLAECRGMAAAFQIGDPLAATPQGSAGGAPVTDGTNNARAAVLNIRGLPASTAGVLMPSDHLQIGFRLHMVLNQVNTAADGRAAVSIWPRLREAPADGTALVLNSPKGLFRLADNKRSYSIATTRLFGISLTLTEAL